MALVDISANGAAGDTSMNDAAEKLRALLEGLEFRNIDLFLAEGEVEDFRRLGERMAELIKELIDAFGNLH